MLLSYLSPLMLGSPTLLPRHQHLRSIVVTGLAPVMPPTPLPYFSSTVMLTALIMLSTPSRSWSLKFIIEGPPLAEPCPGDRYALHGRQVTRLPRFLTFTSISVYKNLTMSEIYPILPSKKASSCIK